MSKSTDTETLLQKLAADGGLYKITGCTDEAIALSRAGRIWITFINGQPYAALAPRSELARLQEKLARNKLTWMDVLQADDAWAEKFARIEAEISTEFRSIGHHPSYPNGFLA
ncbi:hypothetical protein GOC16_15510 [Sinorhizobium meliloti]|nr:hypothetical protein [Sinorhizobium meliloti]